MLKKTLHNQKERKKKNQKLLVQALKAPTPVSLN